MLGTRIDAFSLVLRLNQLSRRCGLSSGVIASMPRPIDVFAGPIAGVAKKAQVFTKAVAGEYEDFESHYRDNRKRLVAYALEIAHLIEKDNDRIAYKFACACIHANRRRTANSIFESLASGDYGSSKYVASAKRRLARLAWKAGDGETAIMTLRSVRGRAARTQYRMWVGLLTVRNGLLLGESGDADSARAVLMGGLRASGMQHALAERVAATYLSAACGVPFDAIQSTSGSGDIAKHSTECGPTPIIVAGFGWSGSGAIADFLKGYPQVSDVFAGREIGIWAGKYGLDRLYGHFTSRGFNRRLLLEFLTRHCFGHSFLGDSRGTKSQGGIWHWLDEPQRWHLLDALTIWLESIQEWQKESTQSLLVAFQDFSSRLLRILTGEGASFVLLSNCIPSDAITGIRMFRAPSVIVSWRDPGDAYTSKIAAFPDNSLGLAGWRDQLMGRVSKYLAGKSEVAQNARLWIDVSFEEFVQSDRFRRQLPTLLNLDGQPLESTFSAAVSAKNIGILRPASGKSRSAWSELARAVNEAKAEAEAISGQSTTETSLLSCAATGREGPQG